MKTLTVTEARKNLSQWLRRAKAGEEIGIVDGADIIALRPVAVTALDYFQSEYGLSAAEAEKAASRILAEAAEERCTGRLVPLEEEASTYDASSASHTKGRKRARKPRA